MFSSERKTASASPFRRQRKTNMSISVWSQRCTATSICHSTVSYFHAHSKRGRNCLRTRPPLDSWPCIFEKLHHKRCLTVFLPAETRDTLCNCSIRRCYGYKENQGKGKNIFSLFVLYEKSEGIKHRDIFSVSTVTSRNTISHESLTSWLEWK